MANVNITDKLTLEIMSSVGKPFEERYKAAAIMTEEDSVMLYNTYYITPKQVELLDQLPDKWVNMSRSDHFTSKVYVAHKMPGIESDKHWLQLTLPTSKRYWQYAWTYSPNNHVNATERGQNSSWIKLDLQNVGLSKDYISELQTICDERDAVIATIEKMITGCKTLNQVEKIWPAIRKYVSADTLARLDKKVERKTAANIGLDTAELQTLSVHHIRQQMTA